MSPAPQPSPPPKLHAISDEDEHTTQQPLILTVEQAARRLGVGRSLMYRLVMTGQIESVTIGRLRRIPTDALDAYITRLRAGRAKAA